MSNGCNLHWAAERLVGHYSEFNALCAFLVVTMAGDFGRGRMFKALKVGSLMVLLCSLNTTFAATECTDAARALVDGSRAELAGPSGYRSAGTAEMSWKTAEGHEGLCRYDRQGRLQAVEITRFPSPSASPYSLTCASANYRRHDCAMNGPAQSVRLDQQYSRSQCIRERTWGFFDSTLWVDKGCNARFVVTPMEVWDPYTVRCESRGDRREECGIRSPSEVTLSRKLSRASCVAGSSWGVERDLLWVDRGCRAEFSVRPMSDGNGGFPDIRGQAANACVSMARTHGFSVADYHVLDVDLRHAEIEMNANRRGIDVSLLCRYDVVTKAAKLYGN
jgi:hypothetical protein